MRCEHWQANRLTNGLPAFAGGLDGDATGVDDAKVCDVRVIDLAQAVGAEQGCNLLALILIDLAA